MAVLRKIFATAIALVGLIQAAQGQSGEYRLKGAYLCRLVDFVDWPAGELAATNSPLIIGILGHDPFGGALEEMAQGQTSRGHPLEIRRYASVNDIGACEELYICASEAGRLSTILHQLHGKPILTVSDISNFSALGGCIRFYTEANKVRFHINLDAAKASRLTISSRLLQLADVTREGSGAP